MTKVKVFQDVFQKQPILAVCTYGADWPDAKNKVWVKWLPACSEDDISLRFYESDICTSMINEIQIWCTSKNLILHFF